MESKTVPDTPQEPETSAQPIIPIATLDVRSTDLDDTQGWAQHPTNPLNWPPGKKKIQLAMLCCASLQRYVVVASYAR
jgi:hypothetical protein